MTTRISPYRFFYAHAGYSYRPGFETWQAGKARCAKALASAEAWALGRYSFEWELDSEIDSSDFSDELPPWSLWVCLMRDTETGRVVQSLHGIDFGRDGEPWGEPYRRVVEAELSCQEQS